MSDIITPQIKAGLVTTIIPVYNRGEMLIEAVESVLAQDYQPIEIIIVDDGSTDDTLSVAQDLGSAHSSIRVLSINNSGPGQAREAGRIEANGEYIQYLDSDDLLMPTKFSSQVAVLKKSPELGACYCKTNVLVTRENRIIENWKRTSESIPHIIPAMLESRWWDTSTPLYRRSVLDLAGPWTKLINEEDWEYDCRVGFTNGKLGYVPEVLSLQRRHSDARLSEHGATDPLKLRSRAQARQAIIKQALKHNEASNSDEFKTLLRYTFLLSRQCGAAGLKHESKELFKLVKPHIGSSPRQRFMLTFYHLGATLVGWCNMGRISNTIDTLRK